MAQTIQIKRGLKASLPVLLAGEMALCTDTKEVFIGDGSANQLMGRALMGTYANRPTAGYAGRLYYVNSGVSLGYIYIDTGSTWNRVNSLALSDLTGSLANISGTLDDIADGTTYAKVKKTDMSPLGHVSTLSDDIRTVTAQELKTHMNDGTIHRTINDSGSASTDLWSAQKIGNEIALAKQGMEYQDSVKDKDLLTPPASPTAGDRYIVGTGTATGAWLNNNNKIATWNGSAWTFIAPTIGTTCIVDDEQKQYTYNGTSWVRSGGALQTVTAGNGLTGGGQADTVTLDIGAGNGITVNTDSITVKPYKGIAVDANGVSANVDSQTIDFAAGNGNKLYVKTGKGIFNDVANGGGVTALIDAASIVYDSANGNRLTVGTVDGGTF